MVTPTSTTSWAYPFALVRRNGGTQMAFIKRAVPLEGGALEYRGYIWSERSSSYTKHLRPISQSDVVREWRSRPSQDAVRAAKRAEARRRQTEAAE